MPIIVFLATSTWILFTRVWSVMVANRSRYLEAEVLRKEWNKQAFIERRLQHIMRCVVFEAVKEQDISVHEWYMLLELVPSKFL
jgi:hypothetical protein